MPPRPLLRPAAWFPALPYHEGDDDGGQHCSRWGGGWSCSVTLSLRLCTQRAGWETR